MITRVLHFDRNCKSGMSVDDLVGANGISVIVHAISGKTGALDTGWTIFHPFIVDIAGNCADCALFSGDDMETFSHTLLTFQAN